MVYVKTVYDEASFRKPEISEYPDEKEAQHFISTCRRWGIGIISCEITEPTVKE